MHIIKNTLKNTRLWIGLAILLIFLYKIELDLTFLYAADRSLLSASIIVLLIETAARAYRWSYITHVFTKKSTFISTAKIYYIGQLTNEIAPQGTGDITKAYLTHKSYRTKTKSILMPVTERISDIFALILGSILIIYTIPLSISKYYQNIAIFTLIFSAILFISLKPRHLEKIISIMVGILTKGKKDIKRGELHWNDMKKKNILAIASITTICWLMEGFAHSLLLSSFGYSLSYLQILAVVCFSWLASIPSFLPGGIGVREIIYAYLLSLTGVPLAIGSLAAVTYRAIIWIKFAILGFLSYYTYRDMHLKDTDIKI